MPTTIHPEPYEVYELSELAAREDNAAYERAIHLLGTQLAQSGWLTEDIGEAIVYGLAEALGSPGWDTYGSADFPGIEGAEITAWDVDRHEITVRGRFTPTTAPRLPWCEGQTGIAYRPDYGGWTMDTEAMDDSDEAYEAAETLTYGPPLDDVVEAIDEAAYKALAAGVTEYEYRMSADALAEDAEANEWRFLTDGTLA